MNGKPENDTESLLSQDSDRLRGQIEELQKDLDREVDARKEERMVWILVVIILLDVYFFTSMQNIIGPLVILAFQLLVVILVARKMGMEQVVQLIDRMIATIARGVSGD